MDKREKRIRQKLKDDYPHYAKKCLKIKPKRGMLKPFILNESQRYIHERIEEQKFRLGYVRVLILKGRQQGCSTYVEGRFFWITTHKKGFKAFILTHLDEASKNVFKMAKRFYNHCPSLVKPSTSASNAKELVFDDLDSGYAVGTAKTEGTGRSDTIQLFHGSEVAYWSNAEDHISGVLQAVPLEPDTEVILESTSAGAWGLFYNKCMSAQKGEGDFELIFVPWYWQPEYTKPVPDDFECTGDEKELKKLYNLTDGQIVWRRSKIIEFDYDISRFKREYPFTIKEAFETEVPGALWTRELLAINRVSHADVPELIRIVVAIDPAVSAKKSSDETGIIVGGVCGEGHVYILKDFSGKYKPTGWAIKAVAAYHDYEADRIVAEVNNGGDMVETTVQTIDKTVSYKAVHASRGKRTRAEPVSALYERGLVHHVGNLEGLENQMTSWDASDGSDSPDRIDAAVWLVTELMLGKRVEGLTDEMMKENQTEADNSADEEIQW